MLLAVGGIYSKLLDVHGDILCRYSKATTHLGPAEGALYPMTLGRGLPSRIYPLLVEEIGYGSSSSSLDGETE